MKECKFWTRDDIGVCSQKLQTTDGNFINPKTVGTYGCNVQEDDKSKYRVDLWQDASGEIHINGTYSKPYLKELVKLMENIIKEK